MAKRSRARKQHYNWCNFGEHFLEEGQRPIHVHPVPVCEAFPDGGRGGDGATVCSECHPEIERLQVEQGILIVVE